MTDELIWVSLQVIWGSETREFRGQIADADLQAMLSNGKPATGEFLRLQNTYVVEYNLDADRFEVLKYGGTHPEYRAANGEAWFRAEKINYIDLLKDGSEYFLDSV